MIEARLSKLGYVVVANTFNAADFGVPQQRRRAWVLCVLKSELRGSESLATDMKQFLRSYVPLSLCLEPGLPNVKPNNDNQQGKRGTKWQEGFKEQCELHGEEGVCIGLVSL